MSQENIEMMRRAFELWMNGELDAWLEIIGWDISTHPLPDVPNHGRGRDALTTEMLATYMGGWTDYSVKLKEIADAGDDVVVCAP